MSIAVLSNVNMDPLKSFLKSEEKYFAGFGQIIPELLDPLSGLNQRVFGELFVHIEGEEFIKECAVGLIKTPDMCAMMEKKLLQICQALQQYQQTHSDIKIVLSSFVLPPKSFLTYLDGNSLYSYSELQRFLNSRLSEFVKAHKGFYVYDWEAYVLTHGYANIVDDKYWYLGRIKYNRFAFEGMARQFEEIFTAIEGKSKKVLVLDLDNTLWGGLIGEDGLGGISLSEDGAAKAYRDFQSTLKALTEVGIILAIISKNNEKDVMDVFQDHPMMVLRKDDFVAKKINWRDKYLNMKDIAQELNLGLDSFVFIDDDPRERALMRQHLSQVIVPEFPADPVSLKTWLLDEVIFKHFPKVYLTIEDTQKVAQYRSMSQRNAALSTMTVQDFIKELSIELNFFVNDTRFLERTTQLLQKTNQFNLTNRRYSQEQVRSMFHAQDCFVFNMEYQDRFGSEGIIAAGIVRIQEGVANVDAFVMSCRVIGKGVEYSLLRHMANYLCDKKFSHIRVEYVPSLKNNVAKDFYTKAGFDMIETSLGNMSATLRCEDLLNKIKG